MQPRSRSHHPGSRQLGIGPADVARRKNRARETVPRNRRSANPFSANPGVQKETASELETVFQVNRGIVALDRKRGEALVGDEAVLHFLAHGGHAERHRVMMRHADDGAGFPLAAEVLVEAEAERTSITVV